ncbi:MAG: leucine--tRNA ligase [Actinobacteria bacterium]|nr:leucine--tRNA ligase [Actinomycetota bacterium]
MDEYDPQAIEEKWQRVWEDEAAFVTPKSKPGAPSDEKYYLLDMLPYPSGRLHVGHVRNYTIVDVLGHFWRRNGRQVLRTMGWDAFGLPAENAAIREGGHPRLITERNMASIREQMKRIGWAIDWTREISSHAPEYYRWTQWLFLKFFEIGQAYRKEAPVKWCPKDQTVLANEQVVDGRCERCGTEVESKSLEQWFFRYTDYAQQMLDEMELLESWPERVLTMQRHWIGRSEGADILFRIDGSEVDVEVFTTRPDTLFGATFFVLAPEHPLVTELVQGRPEETEVLEYVRRTAARTVVEREQKEKDGVFTGRHVVNPATGEPIPIWVADYVLMDYGTGAIMAVPAHDERDFGFAERYGLGVRQVVAPADGKPAEGAVFAAHSENERLVDSREFTGMPAPEGAKAIVAWLEQKGLAQAAVRYRLRDWLLSRQRYWGCPIPVVHCERCGIVPVPEDELPVLLPEVEDYTPRGKAPLAAAPDEWLHVPCPRCGDTATREVDTMDTFVDSSWYFLRYCDPRNDKAPFDRGIIDYWLPVNQYVGGVEHAVMHLLYARYFCKVLNDLGLVGFREPFLRLFNHGWVHMGGAKMSKSKGTSVGPDDYIAEYGADALRLYILFVGPADQAVDWNDSGLEGMARFLRRLWRVVHEQLERPTIDAVPDTPLVRKTHATIAKVSDDIARRFAMNTQIAAVMELVNEISRSPDDPGARFAAETAVSLIQLSAPHFAEELWERLGYERLWQQPWPAADVSLLERETVEVVVQVNGRIRDRLRVASNLPEEELVALARASDRVRSFVDGAEATRTVVVPGKLVNFVI